VASIFLIEDDQAIRQTLVRSLSEQGHSVRAVGTAADALRDVAGWDPEIVVLDLGLPDIDGRDVIRMLRAVSQVPVIVATARDDPEEIVRLLDSGADDYVVKPYSAAEMGARIRAMLRRSRPETDRPGPLRIGGLEIDPVRREATLDGRPLGLTRLEFDLLAHLAAREGEVVTRRQLLAEVWKQPYGGGDKTIDVHVAWLRRKLGESATEPRYLRTVRGVGVKLVDPGA
jgi:two-component system, OmpR family, KDP operon response regulator KdpE